MLQLKGIKPRVGIMAVGLAAYWPQFPNMCDYLLAHHHHLLNKIPAKECELVSVGMIDTVEASILAGKHFKEKDVDLVFCQITTYSASETLLPAIKELDVPVILLNIQSVKALDMVKVTTIKEWLGAGITCAALPEMTAVLKRLGKRFDIITGYLHDDPLVDEMITNWCKTAAVKRLLKSKNFGLLGRPYPGMMDLNIDETNFFNKFGIYIHHLQWEQIVNELNDVSSEEKAEQTKQLVSMFDISSNISSEELSEISEVLSALLHIVEKYNLCGLPNHYEDIPFGKQAEVLAALNPALSMLISSGIACPVEGDIKSTLAMLILKMVGGSATLAELYSMDFNEDVVIIGHSGAGDPAISSRKSSLNVSEVFHGKSGKGYLTQFYPKLGPVTLFSITQDGNGDYRMVAAEGECVEGPLLNLGDTNCRVRFSCGLRDFVNNWSSFGPTHHGVLGLGHHIETLKKIAILLDLPLEIVCR